LRLRLRLRERERRRCRRKRSFLGLMNREKRERRGLAFREVVEVGI